MALLSVSHDFQPPKGAIIKVLWHSNAPWATTGYGVQTGLFAPRMKQRGYEIAVSAFYGLEGGPINWKNVAVLPGNTGTYGNETIHGHASALFGEPRDGIVLTLIDTFVLHAETFGKLNVVSWTPVDHEPTSPLVERYLAESGAVPLAMSRFGERMLEEFDPIYVPHGVDTELYAPVERAEARNRAGISEDQFVVGIVAANKGNPSRKCFAQAFEAFQAIKERHDDAVLCLHTEITGESQGVDLRLLMKQLGIEHASISDQYLYRYFPLRPQEMAAAYSAFDVLLNPSAGEGFGVPIIEAQACGVPVIVTNFSAMPELVGAGWAVDYKRVYTPQMSYQADPHVEAIVEALEECHGFSDEQRKESAKLARAKALEYDVERVLDEHMVPALDEVAERYGMDLPVEDEVAA